MKFLLLDILDKKPAFCILAYIVVYVINAFYNFNNIAFVDGIDIVTKVLTTFFATFFTAVLLAVLIWIFLFLIINMDTFIIQFFSKLKKELND